MSCITDWLFAGYYSFNMHSMWAAHPLHLMFSYNLSIIIFATFIWIRYHEIWLTGYEIRNEIDQIYEIQYIIHFHVNRKCGPMSGINVDTHSDESNTKMLQNIHFSSSYSRTKFQLNPRVLYESSRSIHDIGINRNDCSLQMSLLFALCASSWLFENHVCHKRYCCSEIDI